MYNFFLSLDELLEFVTTTQGKGQLLLYRGNTFANVYKKMTWVCSKKHSGCMVQIKTTVDGKLIFCRGEHNHAPPKFHRSSYGKIYKI